MNSQKNKFTVFSICFFKKTEFFQFSERYCEKLSQLPLDKKIDFLKSFNHTNICPRCREFNKDHYCSWSFFDCFICFWDIRGKRCASSNFSSCWHTSSHALGPAHSLYQNISLVLLIISVFEKYPHLVIKWHVLAAILISFSTINTLFF